MMENKWKPAGIVREGFILRHVYPSKRHLVYLIIQNGESRILKWYGAGYAEQMDKEYHVLSEASSALEVPKPVYLDRLNYYLIMNHINGKNLCDVVNDEYISLNKKIEYINMLSEWLSKFHMFFRRDDGFLLRGDSNLRNFIVNEKVYGLDFEEARIGEPVEDVAEVCSSILTTDPMFTDEKFNLSFLFVESYTNKVEWRIKNVNKAVSYALLNRIKWRPYDKDIISTHAKRIMSKGFI